MRIISFCTICLLGLLLPFIGSSQDFSNKGKDFWVGYGLHCKMFQNSSGGTQEMVLYFATEAVTNVRVEIPALGYVQTYTNIPANTIFTSNTLPKTGLQDSRLMTEGVSNKGIHITSDRNIVAYAHIYNGSISGATLLFPTNTLGKEYYSINFEQHSNEAYSNSFFYAVATDTGTTKIEVIPSANTQNMTGGISYTFSLKQGEVFNALGIINGYDGVDLTGSMIRSISSGTAGCKKIAVFSGSGKINIRCPLGPSGNSADNYMVQAFPKNAWGKNYLTVPTSQMPNNFFRVAVTDPATIVKVNGVVLSGLINNFYYQFYQNNTPNMIEADKPVMVAQYITSANQCGNTAIGGNGDPEVIYLSPVEQNIDKVIINSTQNSAITRHYINVVIPNGGTALNSFLIDGTPPITSFIVHPQNPKYSYLVQNVNPGQHIVQSDSSFNAIAYGYGAAESYGYNAGANVKDLYQFVSLQNQFATVNFPAACKSSPFFFSTTFPYQPTEIKWIFSGLFQDVIIISPVFDSTWFVNGKQLFKYKLPSPYTINNIGTFPIKIIAKNPTPEGCSGEQEINYDLQVFERPLPDFTFTANGCFTDSVQFIDKSSSNGRPYIKWSWSFGDGSFGTSRSPVHLYNTSGSFNVKYSVLTDIGCLSDTIIKTIILSDAPKAKFVITKPFCIGKSILFSDSSTTFSSVISKWYWDFGDGSPVVIASNNAQQMHQFNSIGSYNVSLIVETATGCLSVPFSTTVTISPNPIAGFNFGNACLPLGSMQFNNTSKISDGSQSLLTYRWNFGDGGTSTFMNPIHNFAAVGPYNTTLYLTSSTGCTDSITQKINTIYEQPKSLFTAPDEVCLGTSIKFTDQSLAANSIVNQWLWKFGDTATSLQQHPTHSYKMPGNYTITLTATSAVGCPSLVYSKQVVVNSLPTSSFSFSDPNCVTKDIIFSDASSTSAGKIVKWKWDMGDGTTYLKNSNIAFTHQYLVTGSFTVSLMVETDKGCTSILFTRLVVIHPLPLPEFGLPDNCLNDPFSPFIDSSSIADGSQSQFSYLWNFGDPSATPANPNTSSVKNPKHKYSAVGPYNVSLTVTTGTGCVASLSKQFVVNSSQPKSVFAISSGNTQCSNGVVSITNQSTIDVGRISQMVIFWDDVNDQTIRTIISLPSSGAVYSHSYPEFFTSQTKDYVIRVVVYSGDNCSHASSNTVTIKPTPEILTSPLPGMCADVLPFQIKLGLVNNLPGIGVFTGPGISTAGIFNPGIAGVGTHTIRYTFTGTNGCINFTDQSLLVFPVPVVNAGPDRFVLEGGTTLLLGSVTGINQTVLWSPGNQLNKTDILQPISTPVNDITYTLSVLSMDGCSSSDQVIVKLLKSPAIPNTFSPNGDGIHDKWEIKYLESYPGATIEIYNRYGQLIFQSVGYTKPWDGNFKGNQLPAGTYYYIINPKNGRKQIAGFVDIIR